MKYAAIGLIVFSIFKCGYIYVKTQERKLEFISDWNRILRLWHDWILLFSFSVDELIAKTGLDASTSNLYVAEQIKNKNLESIKMFVENFAFACESDKRIIIEVLNNIGSSLAESEAKELSYAVSKLEQRMTILEKTVKECKSLVIKITPLICGTLAIVLW